MESVLSQQQLREIADLLFSRISGAGMVLTENEAKEYKRLKEVSDIKLITGVQFAKIINCSPASITRMRKTGIIKGTPVGNRWMYRQDDALKMKKKTV